MRLTTLFPQFRGLRVNEVYAGVTSLTLVAATTATTAACPLCHRCGRRVHSRYL